MRKRNITAVMLGLSLMLFAAGCKKKGPAPPPPPPPKQEAPPPPPPARPVIGSFTAEPSTIERGQSATLRWRVENATDISIDQGGSVETIRPTTHADPIYTLHGVIHCGVPNIPAAVPRTSTFALTNATLPYIRAIAAKGLRQAALENRAIACGINCAAGKLTYHAVAEAFGMDNTPWYEALPVS